MTIRFPNPATVETNHAETLAAWGNPKPLPSAEGFAEMQVVRRWAMRSKTAQEILAKVDRASQQINIVVFRGKGETVFSSDDPKGQGTVFWDMDARFFTKQSGGNEPLHHYIALLHELGHAVQWIENPVFFEGNILHGTGGERAMAKAAQDFWMKKAKRALPGGSYKDQRALANTNMMTGQNRMARPAWAVRVEMDNLRRHEWPICEEARYPKRLGYTDLVMSFDSPFRV